MRVRRGNPSIGIILCKDKERVVVENALRESNKLMGVTTYRMASSLLADLAVALPSPEQIGRLLEELA
jgi:hypothetical protein